MDKPMIICLIISLHLLVGDSSAFLLNDRRLARSNFPSVQAGKLIKELNLFPKEDVNIIVDRDPPLLTGTDNKLVEKRINLPNLFSGDVSVDDLGHHAGYYKLPHSHDARMFYFFFESRSSKNDPIVIWLTGGPGCSSELAVFYENGPFRIAKNMSLVLNEYGWDKAFFKEHPQFAKNDFYMTGESYVGHYIPAFASRVHRGNKVKEGIHINLKGFTMG